jgi:ADP-ribose pyrophosphatase YjhB (NUDIX family)
MNEQAPAPERKLWFEGPNLTADAIIIDPVANKILLIQRSDTGEWALPGGFIDAGDTSSYEAAIREAKEETTITIDGHAPLVFRGIVDDPRNDETAWIETSAHVFTVDHHATNASGSDDAQVAAWHDIADLPPLYASHQMIVERGLDHLEGSKLIETFSSPDSLTHVDGGHMEYGKFIFEKNRQAVFAKQHNPERFSDPKKADRSFTYLEKEARTMAHLRQHGFTHLPERSILHIDTLAMDALPPESGWQWQADPVTLDTYIEDALKSFSYLETMPIPADSFDIEPSHISFATEGWLSLDDPSIKILKHRLHEFLPRLTTTSQATAHALLADLPSLIKLGRQPRIIDQLVFCHHDVRQSNLAWHPEHGSKLVDWSWAGVGEPGSDITSLLIDLHKADHDVSPYYDQINAQHCLTLLGFWLGHSTWPYRGDDTVRFQQFVSALSAYDILKSLV